MEDIFNILTYGKPQPFNLEQFIKRPIPKNINPININKPSVESFQKTYSKFAVTSSTTSTKPATPTIPELATASPTAPDVTSSTVTQIIIILLNIDCVYYSMITLLAAKVLR